MIQISVLIIITLNCVELEYNNSTPMRKGGGCMIQISVLMNYFVLECQNLNPY